MARFEEAENRMFNVKICLKCNARNPAAATTCRKCGYTGLGSKQKNQEDNLILFTFNFFFLRLMSFFNIIIILYVYF